MRRMTTLSPLGAMPVDTAGHRSETVEDRIVFKLLEAVMYKTKKADNARSQETGAWKH